jgi:hypothetical protein
MNKILESTKFVSENSKYVSINLNKLKEFANSLIVITSEHWANNIPYNFNQL